ncbi:MAG: CocE/NonD family hydrolase [Paraglaciecola sp.]|uniref:CocE/NonD family hydrolase n=1 Tax=Paraglaciecola sp. TaxID=1920173 RepID=UPI00326689A3
MMIKTITKYLCFTVLLGSASIASSTESSFGKYSGKKTYAQYTRSSQYISVTDGTKLAVDVYRPATGGEVESEPLPVIFYYGRYWRAKMSPDGTIMTNLGPWQPGQKIGSLISRDDSGRLIYWDTGRESIVELMSNGYIFVRAESRGTGASGGISQGDHALLEAQDGVDLINWVASQPWSNGSVGMIGGSYHGMTQLKIAALAPKPLKAIFPAVPAFDLYQLVTGNTGLLHKGVLSFGQGQAQKDGLADVGDLAGSLPSPAPVDNDKDGKQLEKVLAYRKANSPPNALFSTLTDVAPDLVGTLLAVTKAFEFQSPLQALQILSSPLDLQKSLVGKPELQQKIASGLHLYRDTPAFSQSREFGLVAPSSVLKGMQNAAIPMYIWTGWYDEDTVGAFQLFHNFNGPKKITAGLWSHGPNEDNGRIDNPLDDFEAQARELLNSESLRWFDYWLKGRDTGIMDEPSINYAFADIDNQLVWHEASSWPLENTHKQTYFLSAQGAQDDSFNDGSLASAAVNKGALTFTVDYTKTMGPQSRTHDSMSSVPAMVYPDMKVRTNGGGALSFSTPALKEDKLVVGHPIVKLYAKSTASDGEIFAYLEEVDKDGNVVYLTEGLLRASHRKIAKPAYDTFGLPISDSSRQSVSETSTFNQQIVELHFSMQPTANLFEKGHKIRLVLTGADMHNYLTPVYSPSPEVSVFTGGEHASSLTLPMQSIR